MLKYNTIQNLEDSLIKEIEELYSSGIIKYEKKDYRNNYSSLSAKPLFIGTESAELFLERALSLYNQGKYQEAIECFDKALRIDPNFTPAQDSKKLALERLAQEYPSKEKTMPKKKGFFEFYK